MTEERCVHHWIIDSPNGPTSAGRCKKCLITKDDFLNYDPNEFAPISGSTVRVIRGKRVSRETALLSLLINGDRLTAKQIVVALDMKPSKSSEVHIAGIVSSIRKRNGRGSILVELGHGYYIPRPELFDRALGKIGG